MEIFQSFRKCLSNGLGIYYVNNCDKKGQNLKDLLLRLIEGVTSRRIFR